MCSQLGIFEDTKQEQTAPEVSSFIKCFVSDGTKWKKKNHSQFLSVDFKVLLKHRKKHCYRVMLIFLFAYLE